MDQVLIVEDDHDHAELAGRLVRLRNFEPVVAETGSQALQSASALQPKLVLLDLMLPDLTGFEVCEQLRSNPRTRSTPIVMVTALGDDLNRRRGFRVGANSYVTKPYGAQDLYGAMDAAIAWQQSLKDRRLRGEIHLELNSELQFLQEVNEFLTHMFQETPLSTEQIMQLRQALMEMGHNAIEWGNRHRAEQLVRITYRVYDDRIEIVVKDEGAGYDPKNLPHAATVDDPLVHMDVREKLGLREGGFGLLISKGMVDELRHNEKGNEVTLIKRFLTEPPERIPT